MADVRKFVDALSLQKNIDITKEKIAAGVTEAKGYADGLAPNYEPAGAVNTAKEEINGTLATMQGEIDANEQAIATEKSRAEGVEAGLDTAVKAAQSAADKAQGEVDALEEYVGTIPEGYEATTIVEYAKELADNVAANGYDDTALAGRVTAVEGKVTTIEADYLVEADKTELQGKIDAVQGEVDALEQTHATDKKALEDAIALKADQTALDAVSGVANAAATKVALEEEVNRAKGEEARIAGLVSAEAERAAGVEAGLRTDVDAIKGDYLKAADKEDLSSLVAAEETRAKGVEESLQTQINTIMNNPDAEGAINSINEFTTYIEEHGTIADGFRADINDLKEVVPTLETKEDATAKYDEVKAEIAAIPQADWNQSDASAADYVKNRTHYDSSVVEYVLKDYDLSQMTAGSQGMYSGVLNEAVVLVDGQTYYLELAGKKYSCVASGNDLWFYDIENPNHPDATSFGSLTVWGNANGISTSGGQYPLNSGIVSIYTMSGEIKQLDEKFIPDTIARVADMEVVASKVSTLEGQMTTVQGAVATKAEAQALTDAVAALEGADAALDERLEAVEAQLGDGENSVSDLIVAAEQRAKDAAAQDATTKANTAETNAKAHADELNTAMDARVDALEAIDHEHANKAELDLIASGDKAKWDAAEAKAHEHANKAELDKVAEGDVAKWNAAEQNTKDYADGLDKAMTSKVDGIDGRLTTVEGSVATKAEDADLDALAERVTTAEASIASNTAAINAFVAVTADEVTAMWA